jgi:hypothetical protein
MSRRSPFLLLTMLVVGVVSGQWSEPVVVHSDTLYGGEARLLCAAGDTLWVAFLEQGVTPSRTVWRRIRTCWGMGDSWSEPRDATGMDSTCPGWYEGIGFGQAPDRRLWLGWYRGSGYTFQDDSWAICTAVRDSGGWQPFEKSICPFIGGAVEFFSATRQGDWYMAVMSITPDPPGNFSSAMCSRLECDTWIAPVTIKAGRGHPAQVDQGCPVLVPHPDSGVWSVSGLIAMGPYTEVWIHRVVGDSVRHVMTFTGASCNAVADSAGRLWVMYARGEVTRSLVIEDGVAVDSHIVVAGNPAIWSRVAWMCTDPFGWVWAAWREDSRPVVSYNRGYGWSEPEPVADSGYAMGVTSDSRGQLYVLYLVREGDSLALKTTYRLERPGVAERAAKVEACGVNPTICRGMLMLPDRRGAELLDIAGRKVLELRSGSTDIRHLAPGVYFVRRPETEDGRPGAAVRKVVIQR